MPTEERTIPGLLRARATASPLEVAFAYEIEGGWAEISWQEFLRRTERLACALRGRGLAAGSHVGILAPTSLSWELLHHAILRAGGVIVGLEPHDTAERLQAIAEHADLQVLVAANADQLKKKLSAGFMANLKLVVLLEAANEPILSVDAISLEQLEGEGQSLGPISLEVSAEAPATLIYTSGTTGQPKGILYRHEQVTLAVRAITEAYPSLAVGARLVCWLPLANLFQRVMNLAAVAIGGKVFLVSNPLTVLKAMQHSKPDVFIGVPRFFEKLHSGILQEIERKPAWLKPVIRAALAVGDRSARSVREGQRVSLGFKACRSLADKFVLRRLRQAMGGNIRFMIAGSAPTPVRLLEFFDAVGMPVYEAYGLSENVVPMALNRPEEGRFGTVGRQLPPNELRLDEDGELLVRGHGVFSGYYKDDRKAELFTPDGYYRTGDYAAFEADGMLRLRGRKSEVFKTSSGRRISPVQVEAVLERCRLVDRAVVVGASRKCLAAALSLDMDAIPPDWKVMFEPGAEQVPSHIAELMLDEVIGNANTLPEYLRPGGYLILRSPLSLEAGELTPNLKLRRKAIEERYRDDLSSLYKAIDEEKRSPSITLSRPRSASL